MYLRSKFQASSIILKSFWRGVILPPPTTKQTSKKLTQIRVKEHLCKTASEELFVPYNARQFRLIYQYYEIWKYCVASLSNCEVSNVTPRYNVTAAKVFNPFNATRLFTPWKHKKTRGFLMFSGVIKRVSDMK